MTMPQQTSSMYTATTASESVGASAAAVSAPSCPVASRPSRKGKRTSFVSSDLPESLLNKSTSETSTAVFPPKPDSSQIDDEPEPTSKGRHDSSVEDHSRKCRPIFPRTTLQQQQRKMMHRAYSCCALYGNNTDRAGHADSTQAGLPVGSVAASHSAVVDIFESSECVLQQDTAVTPKDYVVVRGVKRVKSDPSFIVFSEGEDDCDEAGGLGEMQVLQLENHNLIAEEVPTQKTSAVISVDGSNGSADATTVAAEAVSVPPTPAFAVPPHPDSCPPDMDPDTFIRSTVHAYLGYTPCIKSALTLPPTFFRTITDEDMASYATDVVAAVRENDLQSIKSLHMSGRTLACCNRFGESLIHMACRRGYTDAVSYLLNDVDVGVRVRDDCGRTPLHDACWNRECKYDIVDMLIRRDPALILISDKRGHTPFMYARREHWGVWRHFLFDRTAWLLAGMSQKANKEMFSSDQ